LYPVDQIGTQGLIPAGTSQLEDWDKKKNKKSVVFDFDTHYSTIPTIHHSNSPKDYAQEQRSPPESPETPEILTLFIQEFFSKIESITIPACKTGKDERRG